jgi:FKBP-type peptidyl-prolyl cis-trans isomerase
MESKEVVLVEGKLTKLVHAEGEGEVPQKGQEIFALYRGTLQNGTEFDSNLDRDSPFSFVLGEGNVIKGWDEGFASMKKGEKATLVCSPEYAYGARGSPPKIPANATLNFEVELLDFKDKKKEKWELSDE